MTNAILGNPLKPNYLFDYQTSEEQGDRITAPGAFRWTTDKGDYVGVSRSDVQTEAMKAKNDFPSAIFEILEIWHADDETQASHMEMALWHWHKVNADCLLNSEHPKRYDGMFCPFCD